MQILTRLNKVVAYSEHEYVPVGASAICAITQERYDDVLITTVDCIPTDIDQYNYYYIDGNFIKETLVTLEGGVGKYAVQQIGSEAIGDYSFSRGSGYTPTETAGEQVVSNKAHGLGSTAEGAGTETMHDGIGAHAEGSIGKTTSADNSVYRTTRAGQRGAHAEGCGTYAYGKGAHSEGYVTDAVGEGAHSEGKRTRASGVGAHAEGKGLTEGNKDIWVIADGEGSHAEGVATYASGKGAHAEGIKGKAIGDHSHVEGADGEARGKNSHVEGWACKTGEDAGASHAGGEASQTTAYGAFAHGAWLNATIKYQTVFGTANSEDQDALFIVGYGELDKNDEPISRKNAFSVNKNGKTAVLDLDALKTITAPTIKATAVVEARSVEATTEVVAPKIEATTKVVAPQVVAPKIEATTEVIAPQVNTNQITTGTDWIYPDKFDSDIDEYVFYDVEDDSRFLVEVIGDEDSTTLKHYRTHMIISTPANEWVEFEQVLRVTNGSYLVRVKRLQDSKDVRVAVVSDDGGDNMSATTYSVHMLKLPFPII